MKKLITFLFLLVSVVTIGQGTLVFGTSSVEAARVKLKGNPNNYTLTKVDTTFKIVGLTNTYDIKFGDDESIATRSLTLNPGTGVNIIGGTQTLEANRTWTISIPQSVSTSASPTFAGITLSSLSNGVLKSTSGVVGSSAIVNADIASNAAINYAKIAGLTVNTITDLKSKTAEYNNQIVKLLGYYTAGDGGENEYIWNSTSTATANDATIIQVTGISTGRWIMSEKDKVNIKSFGAVGDNSTDNTSIVQNAINYFGSGNGWVIIPADCNYNYNSLTVGYKIIIEDVRNRRLIQAHTALEPSLHNNHILMKSTDINSATRFHIEPNGNPKGTASKQDWMFDPYESNAVDYRIANIYTKTYDSLDAATTKGNGGVAVLGVKGEGTHWGLFPTLHVGFSDNAAGSATPLKLYYFDTSDNTWRTPMRGGWRSGMSVNSGDYITASSKLYQAGSTGTTGSTKPTHSSGSASDGSINFTFIRDFAVNSGNFKGTVVIGDRDDMPKFGLPTVRTQFSQDVALWNAKKIRFLDQNAVTQWSIYDEGNSDNLYIENSNASSKFRLASTGKFIQVTGMGISFTAVNAADADATPTIKGVRTLNFQNTGATSVTRFDDGIQYQEILVRTTNTNTTLVHGANIKLIGGVNRVLAVDEVVHFQMNAGGTIANEVR